MEPKNRSTRSGLLGRRSFECVLDATQRSVFFCDDLRQRSYRKHLSETADAPHRMKFEPVYN